MWSVVVENEDSGFGEEKKKEYVFKSPVRDSTRDLPFDSEQVTWSRSKAAMRCGCLLLALVTVASTTIPTIPIAPGVNMPLCGLGTGPPYSAKDTENAFAAALALGYRAVDTAHNYKNQASIARAISRSGVPRSDIFITSKLPGSMTFAETLNVSASNLMELNTTYVDLLLVHFPCPSQPYNESLGSKTLRQQQWKAMENIYNAGHARAIGVSHFCQRHMENILEIATVPIAANQVEYHVGMAGGANAQKWMVEHNITLLSFLPLCGQCGDDRYDLINGTLVSELGRKYNRSGVQIALKWLTQNGVPAIPRSRNPTHIAENCALFDWELSANDLAVLEDAIKPRDGPQGDSQGDCKIP